MEKQWKADCLKESGVSQESLNKLPNYGPEDDPKLGDNAICMLKKLGWISQDGNLLTEKIKSLLKERLGDEKGTSLAEKCVKQKKNAGVTAHDLLICLMFKSEV